MVPRLSQDFPTQVCVHVHETHGRVPAGQRLPVFILISRQGRVVVFEGMPEYDGLKLLLQDLLSLEGGGPSTAK
jgi:hypothetical protein